MKISFAAIFKLIFVLALAGWGLYQYKRVPASVIEFSERIAASSPEVLDDGRRELLSDFDSFILESAPRSWGRRRLPWEFPFLAPTKLTERQTRKAVEEIRTTEIPSGKLRLWYLYNMGIVAKTSEATVAFDISSPPFCKEHRKLADLVDVFITSHRHGDHYDTPLLRAGVEKGATAVFPKGCGLARTLRSGADSAASERVVELNSAEEFVTGDIKVTFFQTDHRGDKLYFFPCGWFQVEMSGFKLLHTGDGQNFKNRAEREQLHQQKDLDIFLVNIALSPFEARDLGPRVVIPLHMHEIMHNKGFLSRSRYEDALAQYAEHAKDLEGIEIKPLLWGESLEIEPRL